MASFAIEVPGEANPLTEAILVQTLTSAASSDPNQIQTGTKQLAQWEKTPAYYRHLQSAYLEYQLPVEIRYLAIIQLKNGIDKYWRKTAQNAVSKEDKQVIRSRLVDGILNEQDNRLALQNALVIAKIARYEFPNDWQDALSGFVNVIRSTATPPLQLARALLALLHIVKELSTGRLQRTRTYLQAVTPEVITVVGNVYARIVDSWRSSLNPDDMHQSLLAIKLLRRLLVTGYDHPSRDGDVVSFWNLSIDQLSTFLPQMNSMGSGDASYLLGKHVLQLAKLHHAMAKDHPASFALLPNFLPLTHSYWGLVKEFGNSFGSKEVVVSDIRSAKIGADGDAADEKTPTEKIALKGLLILRACVKMVHNPANTFKYRTPEDKEEKNRATEIIRQNLLANAFVQEVLETMVLKFFVFRQSDLREWLEEPEEWEKREEGEADDWEFSIRSCAEKLFLDLAINYKDIIVEPLLNVFYSVAGPQHEDVLFKDSVYTAIGLSASVIHPKLDFDAFIRDILVAEVQKEVPGWNIIRRRAAILLGQWITIKVSQETRPVVYQIFQHLLNADDPLNDQVVRVTAGRQFMNVANDWDFQAEAFMPYAQTILTQLMTLIEEVELTETKMAILNTVSVIVERLDYHITPFAERIVNLLPGLWKESETEYLMKQAILTILARLVNAMKADSLPLHSLVFPLIQSAVEPGSDAQLYLLEEALDLWGAVLEQTPSDSASQELLQLSHSLIPVLEFGSENLRKTLEIAESYVILAPTYMLSTETRTPVFQMLAKLFGQVRAEINGIVCNLVETMLRFAQKPDVASNLPLENYSSASFMLTHSLATCIDPEANASIFSKLLQGLRGSYIAHCTTGPNALDSPVDGIVETDYFSIFARAILGSLDGFLYTCQTAANTAFSEQQPLEALMKWLLEEWFSHFENVGDPGRRKLMCMALTKLLETNQEFVLLNLQSLMTVWTDVVTELREDEADTKGDSLVMDPASAQHAGEAGPESPEDQRRRVMTLEDQVHTVNVVEWVRHYLQGAIAAAGGNEAFQERWLVNVDKDVVKAFSELGVL